MYKVNALIKDLCPNGVEYKTLSEILEVFHGYAFESSFFNVEGQGIPLIRIRDVNTGFSHTYYSGTYDEKYLVNDGDLLIGMDGDFRINRWSHGPALLNQRVCRLQNLRGVLDTWIFHVMHLELEKIQEHSNSGTVDHLSSRQIGEILIPIPPIAVQEEIVSVLNQLTVLKNDLVIDLEKELAARKLQHKYFLESIFNSDKEDICSIPVSELCSISRGTVMSKDYIREHPGEFPVYSSQTLNNGILGCIDTFSYDFESLTWTTDGANAGSIFLHQNEKFSITNVCGLLRIIRPDMVIFRYLYHALKYEAPKFVSAGMGNPKLMAGTMGEIELHLPNIQKQQELAQILDALETLHSRLFLDLQTEIANRKSQYEYYRAKLLTFKELEVA